MTFLMQFPTVFVINEKQQSFNGYVYNKQSNKAYIRRSGPYSVDGIKVRGLQFRIHRDIWEFHNGPIPEGHDIHHIDGNENNNYIENFELLSHGEHRKLHMAIREAEARAEGRKVSKSWSGCVIRPHSEKTKLKMRLARTPEKRAAHSAFMVEFHRKKREAKNAG